MLSKIRGQIARWGVPAVAVAVVLAVLGIASAVTQSSVTGGVSVTTLGDSWVAVTYIDSTAHTFRGPIFELVSNGATGDTGDSRALGITRLRHVTGSISNNAVKNATFRISGERGCNDSSPSGSFAITMQSDTQGTGTWIEPSHPIADSSFDGSNQSSAGETNVHLVALQVQVNDSGAPLSTAAGDAAATLRGNGILLAGSQTDVGGDAINTDSRLAFTIRNFAKTAMGATSETIVAVLVYNVQMDSFINKKVTPDSALIDAFGHFSFDFTTNLETGTNYIYIVAKGGDTGGHYGDTVLRGFRQGNFDQTDSIAFKALTVVLYDTSIGGAVASGVPTATTAIGCTSASTTAVDTAQMLVWGSFPRGSVIVAIDPVSATSAVVQAADSRTTVDTHSNHGIFDFQLYDTAGVPLFTTTDSITIQIATTDTYEVLSFGWRLIYLDQTIGEWRDLSTLAQDSTVHVIRDNNGDSSITLRAHLKTLPGVIVAVGAISGTPTATDEGGTCLLEALFNGTSLEAALPMIRGARDLAMGSTAGRFAAFGYYAFGVFALLALAGTAALSARK